MLNGLESSGGERGARRGVVWAVFALLALVTTHAFTAGAESSPAGAGGGVGSGAQRPPATSVEEIKKDFNDDDLKAKDDKPAGNWSYSTQLDPKRDDPSAPAYVSSIQLLSGGGKYQGVNKIKRVMVTNRSSQALVSVQVRFEVFKADEPEKILLEETFPSVNVSIAQNAPQVVELQTLHPPRMLKALAGGGELNGHFVIRMGVREARFADGSFWSGK